MNQKSANAYGTKSTTGNNTGNYNSTVNNNSSFQTDSSKKPTSGQNQNRNIISNIIHLL